MSDSSDQPLFHYICRGCGSENGFRSRRRNLMERCFLPLLFLQPVRCGECFRRDYRLIFTPVFDRLSESSPRIVARKPPAPPKRNVA